MHSRQEDGFSLRVHLENAANNKLAPDYDAQAKLDCEPCLPFFTDDLWAKFQDLHIRRDYNEGGPKRFSWQDIQAYETVKGMKLDAWTLRNILMLENLFFIVRSENEK
jgi:hypothetical protein